MFKSLFYLINTIFAIFYLYPGSIMGFILYKDLYKQPQLTDDFNFLLLNFSSNHIYAFLFLSFFVSLFFLGSWAQTIRKFGLSSENAVFF